MKQKIVIKVQMNCEKCRSKALKVAAVAYGVSSVAIDGPEKERIVVIGDEVDSACLISLLRKKVGYASLVSVQEEKPKKDEEKKPTCQWVLGCPPCPRSYMYEVVSDPSPSCSIM